MEIVQEIGAYAGLAAVLGLAVLSALYFSQARDVRRLREWAGRAPERTVAPPAHMRTNLPPGTVQPRPGAPVRPGQPGGPGQAPDRPAQPARQVPAPARPAQGGAGPATAVGGAAVAGAGPSSPAARSASAATDAPPADADLPPASEQEKPDAGGEEDAKAGESAESAAAPTEEPEPSSPSTGVADSGRPSPPAVAPAGRPAPLPRPVPRLPARPAPPRPAGGHTQIIPPAGKRAPWYRRDPRLAVLAVAGVLIVGGAAAFGITQLVGSGGDEGGEQRAAQPSGSAGAERPPARRGAVNPASVTVSVLNGTPVPGLAAQIGDEVEAKGFQLGNVTNASDRGVRNESVVFYASGAEREAIAVGRALNISQREGIDAQTQSQAGDARVAVLAGSDKTR